MPKKPLFTAPARDLESPQKYIYPYQLPTGETRFRVRVRTKKIGKRKLEAPVNENFGTLEEARKFLYELEFTEKHKAPDLRLEILKATSVTTFSRLFEQYQWFRKKQAQDSGKKLNETDLKSRCKVICETLIPLQDDRIQRLGGVEFKKQDFYESGNHRQFGEFAVKNFSIEMLNKFVFSRLKKVKAQTATNDVIMISSAIKMSADFFADCPRNNDPLKEFNWKLLAYTKIPKNKRLKTEQRIIVENLMIASKVPHYYQMFVFLTETGCRISEALATTVQDVDLTRAIINIISAKSNRRRALPITPKLFPIITELMGDKKSTAKLFKNSQNTYQTKLRTIRPQLQELGLKFTWHMCRHTFVSNNIDQRNELQLMHNMNIRDSEHFKAEYLDQLEAEKIAQKKARAEQLTPDETRQVVGHASIEQTNHYTHFEESPNELTKLLFKQQEQINYLLKKLDEKK